MTDDERAVTRDVLRRRRTQKFKAPFLLGIAAEGSEVTRKPKPPATNFYISVALFALPVIASSDRVPDQWILSWCLYCILGLILAIAESVPLESLFLPPLIALAVDPEKLGLGIGVGLASRGLVGAAMGSLLNTLGQGTVPVILGSPATFCVSKLLKHIAGTSLSKAECVLLSGGLMTLFIGNDFPPAIPAAILLCGILPFAPVSYYLSQYVKILRQRRPDIDRSQCTTLATGVYSAYFGTAVLLFGAYLYITGNLYELCVSIVSGWPVFAWWFVCLAGAGVIALQLQSHSALGVDSRRKLWHLTSVVMFWPVRHQPVTPIALPVAIVLFLFLEMVRATALPPYGQQLHQSLQSFVDYRDTCGPLVVSHIYLLLGISWPILVGNGSPAGVLCLGLGDTCASQIGRRYGRFRVFGDKSLEGAVAFCVAVAVGLVCSGCSTTTSVMVGACCALMEATSPVNDNIVLPSYMLILIQPGA